MGVSFLNERLSGWRWAWMTGAHLDDPELGPAERAFLGEVADAFAGSRSGPTSDLYVEGRRGSFRGATPPDLPRADSRRGARGARQPAE